MPVSDEHSLEPWKYLSLLTRCATPLILTPGDLPNANLGWPGEMDNRMTKKATLPISNTAFRKPLSFGILLLRVWLISRQAIWGRNERIKASHLV